MINSQRLRLALVALAASAAALTAVPAQAAPAPSQARIQSVATAQVASLVDSPISPMRCRDDGQGCPPVKEPKDCNNNPAPTSLRRMSQHIWDRMAERKISEQELQDAVRIGARTATCQDNGRWKYELGMSGGLLVVIVSWDGAGVTAWWVDPK